MRLRPGRRREMPRARRLTVLAIARLAVFATGGCASHVTQPPYMEDIIQCTTVWREACRGCGTATAPRPIPADGLDIGVVFHVMRASDADMTPALRKYLQDKEPRWKLAPAFDEVTNVWTPATIDILFGPRGVVNKIWKQAKIHLSPRLIETCDYWPQQLRLDGRGRESMIMPESKMPWGPELFRSINRLFVREDPRVIHVLIWWSIEEPDSGMSVYGYARSAAHGGPAVWADTYQCFKIDDGPSTYDSATYVGCGRLLAHEIGHAFGLQHVDATGNLMHMNFSAESLTREQIERARREATQQFLRE